jgi:hypothetical protein
MTTGFQQINQQLWINKDPEAQLFYTFDWSEWLVSGDTIASAVYTVTARVNDPDPLAKVTSGISSGTKTYIQLKDGQEGKSYVVAVKVTTANGLIDRRNFRVKVENRSA